MNLRDLGYSDQVEADRIKNNWQDFLVGRVIAEHKDRYMVRTSGDVYDSEVLGNIRFTAQSRLDFPGVGDWVAISPYDENKALIHGIFPRYSTMIRKAVGQKGKIQLIACNVDYGIIVQAVDRDFNLNRLERYLTICSDAKILPIIVLSKVDLIDSASLAKLIEEVSARVQKFEIITVSKEFEQGYAKIRERIEAGKTYCLLGSSGVGKSTLLNHLQGSEVMNVSAISESVNKGRHTTTHRELFVLDSGGIIIDNPGMRELGMAEGSQGLQDTFQFLFELSQSCKYSDCRHLNDDGCAVLEALENGELDEDSYLNYLKLEKEKKHFQTSKVERRKKDRQLGKLYKNIQKQKYDTRYK